MKRMVKSGVRKGVAISTRASIREMVLPGLVAVSVLVDLPSSKNQLGFWHALIGGNTNALMLGGLLASKRLGRALLALFQSTYASVGQR